MDSSNPGAHIPDASAESGENASDFPDDTGDTGGFSRIRRDWIEPVLIALVLVFCIRAFIFQPFRIPSGSMEDTLLIGDQIIVLKCLYGVRLPFTDTPVLKLRDPRPGDVIVFKYPPDPAQDFIKRCIATGGQTVRIERKRLYVDGRPALFPAHAKFLDPAMLPAESAPRDDFGPVTVPAGMVFVLGDNRDNSNDSRFWGFVPLENVTGAAKLIYWSRNAAVPFSCFQNSIRWNRLWRPIR